MVLCVATWGARADVPSDALAQARHDLAVSEQVLTRLTARVEAAKGSPATRPEERQRLDEYIARVRELVALNRARVRDLEGRVASRPVGVAGSPGDAKRVATATEDEQVAMLDAQLDESLAAFDKLLLDEARKARTRDAEMSASNGGGGGAGNGGATGSSKSRDAQSGSSESGDSAQGTGRSQRAETEAGASGGAQGDPRDGTPGGPIGGRERGGSGSESATAPPPDVGNGNDDDIVARQIRKAAEAESDPELKKRLWDEYRKYRQGMSQGTRPGASG